MASADDTPARDVYSKGPQHTAQAEAPEAGATANPVAPSAPELRSGPPDGSRNGGIVWRGAHRFGHNAVAKDADGGDLRQEEAVLGVGAVQAHLGRRVRIPEEPRDLRNKVVAVVHAEGGRHLVLEVVGEAVVADAGAAVRVAGDRPRRVPAHRVSMWIQESVLELNSELPG